MRWYSYLKNKEDNKGFALLDCEKYETPNIIILRKLTHLQFTIFENYLHFAKFMLKNTPENERCFYETVFGNNLQKPYFDIEFFIESNEQVKEHALILPENEADESVKFLINCVYEELQILGQSLTSENILKLNQTHILVFTSHNKHKKSYHIVVEGFCLSNNKETKEFHDRVMKKMPDKWKGIVDHGMYKSIQQFRIVGNTKYQSNRYKILNEELTLNFTGNNGWIPKIEPESEDHKILLLLEASLISQTSSCITLICKPEEKKHYNFNSTGDIEGFNPLTPEDVKEALALCYKYANLEFGDSRFPYNFLSIVENNGFSSIILLKRLRPSTCAICDRVHENENPYLIVSGPERAVYLDCRRNPENKKLLVGKLGLIKSNPGSPKSVEEKEIIHIEPPKPEFDPYKFIQSFSTPKVPVKPTESTNKMLAFSIY